MIFIVTRPEKYNFLQGGTTVGDCQPELYPFLASRYAVLDGRWRRILPLQIRKIYSHSKGKDTPDSNVSRYKVDKVTCNVFPGKLVQR